MAFRILDLPVEIQLVVGQHLERGQRLELMCSSRHFHDLLLPQLYERLDVEGEAAESMAILVQSLLSKPFLSNYPRTLYLTAWDCQGDDEDEWTDARLQEELHWLNISLIHAKVNEIARSDNEATLWIRQINQCNPDAWLALLLFLLPNVTRLQVQFPPESEHFLRVIRGASERPFNIAVLPSLREVYITGCWDEFQGDPATFLVVPFLGLPSLRRLTTDAITDDQYPIRTVPSSITHLELDHCTGPYNLGELVSACPRLTSFRHDFFPHSVWDPNLRAMDIYYGLLQAKDTLTSIWLGFSQTFIPADGSDDIVWPSMKEFSALQFLHVPIFVLMNCLGRGDNTRAFADILPPSIEALHITGIRETIAPRILPSILDYVRSNGGKLKQLILETPYIDRGPILKALETLSPATDVSPGDSSHEVMEVAVSLSKACVAFNIDFAVCEENADGSPLKRLQDPFQDLR